MKKHKICIIGDGLSGLITAYLLGKLNLKVDLISGKKKNNNIDVRTTAISPSNLNFLKKQNLISKIIKFTIVMKSIFSLKKVRIISPSL